MFKAWVTKKRTSNINGFTIVELLIVVVVIAILAAITIVAYNGIQNRAKTSAAQSAASQAAKKIATYAVTNSETYPQDKAAFLSATGLIESAGTTYEYSSSSPYSSYCLTTTSNNVSYFTSSASQNPTSGGCPGHGTNGQSAVTNYVTNPHAVTGGSAWTNQTPTGGTASYNSTGAQDGGSAYQVLVNNAGQFRLGMPQSLGTVVSGDVVYVGMEVYAPAATAVQMEVGAGGVYPKSAVINLTSGWNQIQTTVTISTGGSVSLVQLVSTGSVASGQTWRASKGFASKGATTYQYGDGNSASWVWNGSVNASTSKGPAL